MPERPYPPSISPHLSDFDFDVCPLHIDGHGHGDDDLRLIQAYESCVGGNGCLQAYPQEDETLGRSLHRSSASPRFSDFDFDAALISSDGDINNRRHAIPYSTGHGALDPSYGLSDGLDADIPFVNADGQLTTDTGCYLEGATAGFESDLLQDSDDYDEISQEAQVVPDQECALGILEEMMFNVDEAVPQREAGADFEFWVGDKLSESSDWLAFEQVSEMPECRDSDEKRDDLLHSLDWAMLEDKSEGKDGDVGSTVPSEEYLHSSDWAILADNVSHGHLERSRDHQHDNSQELASRQDRDFERGQTASTTLKGSETAPTTKLCRPFMTTSPQPREWVLEKLEMMACQVLEDLALGRTPEIELSSRTKAGAIVYDDANGVVRRVQDRSPLDETERSPSNPVETASEGLNWLLPQRRFSQSVKCAPCAGIIEAKDETGHDNSRGTRSDYSKVTRYSDRHSRTFSRILRLSSIIHEGLEKQTVASKRDLFYRDVNLFRSQPVVDKMVEDMACTLRVPRSSLNVMAGGRSILFGSLRLTMKVRHKKVDSWEQSSTEQQTLPAWLHSDISQAVADTGESCILTPEPSQPAEEDPLYSDYMRTDYNTPVTLPGLMDDIVHIEMHPKTLFVLVIEKESTFLHLARSGFCITHGPCILLTSKGYPDFVARQLLKHLERIVQDGVHTMFLPYSPPTFGVPALRSYSADYHVPNRPMSLKIPLLALVDCDPHGFKIFLTYRCGSVECAYDNANLAVPSLKCLGQFPIDWDPILKGENTLVQERLERQLIPLLPRDRSALVKLLTRHPFIKQSREWQVRISRMLMANRKSEIQSLDLEGVESESVVSGEGVMGGLERYLKSKLQSFGVYNP